MLRFTVLFFLNQENQGDLPKVKEKYRREKLNSYGFTHPLTPSLVVSHESDCNVIKSPAGWNIILKRIYHFRS